MHSHTVEDNLGLVWSVINRYFNGGKNFKFMGYDPEDIYQIGVIGLIKAVSNFDEDKGFMFSTFATHKIIGEVKREIRDNGKAVRFPRGANEIAIKIIKQERKDTITVEEIMEEFGVDNNYAMMVINRIFYNTVSGDMTISDETRSTIFDTIEDSSLNVESDALNPVELEQRLSVLGERDRYVMELGLEGLTQSQIADVVGVSQMQISRIMKKSLKIIEKRFDNVSVV